ncbi:PREDICTED: DENN domain-containing protein 3-like, partial [Amphimedon queenslandica]|uniref:UDENN domain-containing protein n=3 Tax=Amphimedon queenslandica TaxID=400682 RepID=A0AAN0K428_AMPQE
MPPRGDLHLDVRLNYPFLCLSVDNVLKVIAALLSEQTIVFTSSNYSMPALVIQCLLSYISPFEWRHSIVPTVPDNFIDILGAPSINILGCHSNWHESPEFTNIDDAVIVKLDEDVVESKLSSLSS